MRRPGCRVLLLVLAVGGCRATYPAYPIVPPPRAERVPEPPRSAEALSWRPGYYDWAAGHYVWVPGQWVPLAGHSAMWQDGYWRRTSLTTYQWVSPGWK